LHLLNNLPSELQLTSFQKKKKQTKTKGSLETQMEKCFKASVLQSTAVQGRAIP